MSCFLKLMNSSKKHSTGVGLNPISNFIRLRPLSHHTYNSFRKFVVVSDFEFRISKGAEHIFDICVQYLRISILDVEMAPQDKKLIQKCAQ